MRRFFNGKTIILLLGVFLLLFMIWPSLNPFDPHIFDFHDTTQLSRVDQFTLNLKSGQIPPRLSPQYSFNMGFPMYNFYAPAAYWITSAFQLVGMSAVMALKLSFFLTVVLSFLAMYVFLTHFFKKESSLFGASLYVTATYFATEIVIRGNLSEAWYLVLLPLSLHLLYKNAEKSSKRQFFLTTIVLFLTLTVHNVFSLLSIPLFVIFILLLPKKKANIISLITALLLGSYFFIPAILESSFASAGALVKEYNYKDHFLCMWQLWKSNGWLFGSSLPGCDNDQMSFKLGKIPLIFGVLGIITLAYQLLIKKRIHKNSSVITFVASLTLMSLFMVLSYSQPVWTLFEKILALFQFPWRFNLYTMFGLAFLGSYFIDAIKLPLKTAIIIFLIAISFITAQKYFIKPMYDYPTYNKLFNSPEYVSEKGAYMIAEFIPSSVNRNYWSMFDPIDPRYRKMSINYKQPAESDKKLTIIKNDYFKKEIHTEKQSITALNIHYLPMWKIYVNGNEIVPSSLDTLGRPIITTAQSSTITISYQQTLIEKISNIITVLTFIVLIFYTTKFFPRLHENK